MKNAEVLKKLISESGMSIKEFAATCRITPTTCYNILRKGVIRVDTAIKICTALNGRNGIEPHQRVNSSIFEYMMPGDPKK